MVESEDVKKAEIDRLYKENVSKVYRTALYYVEDHYVAEEIVQEVFLKLYDNLGDICMESVPAWLITTAKNMAKNYLRDSKWETPMEEVPEQEVPYSSEGLDAQLIEVFRQKECRELHDTIFADLYEIIFQERRYQEKPIFQGLQKLWNAVRCAGIYIECNTYAAGMQQRY